MTSIKQLLQIAQEIRRTAINLLYEAQSGHPGSSLSIIDLVTSLYFTDIFKHNSKNPNWDKRDYFLLSNGHAVPGYYSLLAHAGYYPLKKLHGLRQINTPLHGHPKRGTFPGIEVSSGSLGQNLSVGLGMALALKLKKQPNRVWVMMSDGEHQEGSTWEAVMLGPRYKLNNLIAIVDKNLCQINDYTKNIMPSLNTLKDKYQAFGWHTLTINGHDFTQILAAYKKALTSSKPTVIIANTVIGKGVSFMEGDYHWHHGTLTKEQYHQALKDLK